ncbi:huntingtin-associated protein 1 [Mirounga leonina]|uniref:huntingtin-associated protein 1 n=1 Tax=Mirounga leonina TaxID=9715 RepID=UPI00156C4BEF|nr:huntingtin-associated protein 1 [Mirounga leonina]
MARRAPTRGAGYKGPAAAADCGLKMRPKESGSGYARHRFRPRDPAGITLAPPLAANPAPEPSAQFAAAPARAPAAGQGAGSRSPSVSGRPAGARPTSEAGSAAGAPRASAFSAAQRHAQSVPGTSDAPWTRFIFQGPFGPPATGLGTGKAAGIWKTPAAYIGRRPGVSGPERAAFIRELEEALCPDRTPPVKITQEDVRLMLNLLEEVYPRKQESIPHGWGSPLQRERDLNTVARIGQSLAKRNSVLMEENSKLEAMLGSAREEILHLRHQVSLRDDLLQLYSDSEEEEEEEEDEEEEEGEEGEEEQQHDHPYGASEPTSVQESESPHYCPKLETLQEQLRRLEEENEQLREEASHLDALEEEEQMLILDCVEQFSEASQQMAELSDVLALRMETHSQQRREVAQLRTQVLMLRQCCQTYGAQTEKLQRQLASEKEIQMQLQDEEALPGFQETLAEELRMSIRRIISDPVFFIERCGAQKDVPVSLARYKLCCGEAREQERGFEAEKGLMTAEDFVPSEEEERGATEEGVSAEEGLTEEAELVSEEAEAWEEVEPELDEATQTNAVTSTRAASGLGPSHLSMRRVLRQLANWQDSGYRWQLRQKMLQEGECSRRGLPLASRTSCRSSSR